MSEINSLIQTISPDHYESFKRWKKINNSCGALLCMLLASASCYQFCKLNRIKKKLTENTPLQQHHTQLQEALKTAQVRIIELTKKLDDCKPFQTAGSTFLEQLHKLSTALAPDLRITLYQHDAHSLSIQGESHSLQSVMALSKNLNKIPHFAQIQLQTIKPITNNDKKLYHFQMSGSC